MIKDGLSSCQAEKELEYLRVENVALRAQSICPGSEYVTHWMPLPAAPEKGE